jgi:selenocysteine lyase/cysteine desulfurase
MRRMVTRRGLLTGAAAAAAGGAVVAAVTGAVVGCEPDTPAPPLDPNNWASVRAQFALNPDVAHFAAFVFASHPASVRAAIEEHRAGLDADPYGYLGANEAALDAAVADAAAAYLHTTPDQIAFTDSTTMGLGLLYTGLRLRAGDEVLTTEHDFYATHEALRLRQLRDGVAVRRIRLYDEPESASADQIVQRLRSAIGPSTRVIAVTWVHSSTGVKLPIRAMADALMELNAGRVEADRVLLCVDGVHGFGVEDTTPDALGCDFLVSGCHKWLFGPRGTGLIWGRGEAWRRFTPVVPSFTGDSIVAWLEGRPATGPPGPAGTPGGYHSFEHRWALAEAFALHRAVGPARVAERARALVLGLKDGLAGISTVRLRTPRAAELSAGIVCCEVEGYRSREAVARLRAAKVIASPTPYAMSYVRLGASVLNDESDVDTALRAVRAL